MTSFDNLAIEELNTLANARKLDGYENMSRQQLQSTFSTISLSKHTLKPIPGHKKCTPIYTPKPAAYLYFKISSKT